MGVRIDVAPRISKAGFAEVLRALQSPAAPWAAGCYDAILPYRVDPAIGLAFFYHESGGGRNGAAAWTHNWGNVTDGGTWLDHHDGTAGRWLIYRTRSGEQPGQEWIRSAADWAQLVRELYCDRWGRNMVEDALLKYAPYEDQNDPASYAATVKRLVEMWQRLYPVDTQDEELAVLRKAFLVDPVQGKPLHFVSTRGVEAGLDHLEIIAETTGDEDKTTWKFQVYTEEVTENHSEEGTNER